LIYNAIKKYGWDAFEIEWYECLNDYLNDHEEFWVEILGTLTPCGYNLMGGGGSGGKRSEETKRKMSESHLGKIVSDETRKKLGEAKSDKNNPMYGKTGEKNNTSKRVYQYDLDGTFIDSFGSCEEARRYLKKKTSSSISACAHGSRKYKTAYKFKWSYTFPFN
jgi:group I intron endonuclease